MAAQAGNLLAIPARVRVVSYRTLRCIAADHDKPVGIVRDVKVFWVQQEPVRVVELGTRQEWMLIVRIPEVNFGVAIRVRRMLLSTNFEEVSMLPTYCDGLTVTLYEWRLKGHPYHLLPPGFGSHQILNLATGIPSWT